MQQRVGGDDGAADGEARELREGVCGGVVVEDVAVRSAAEGEEARDHDHRGEDLLGRYRGDAGEMQGRCRGDAGEMQGRCRGDIGEM